MAEAAGGGRRDQNGARARPVLRLRSTDDDRTPELVSVSASVSTSGSATTDSRRAAADTAAVGAASLGAARAGAATQAPRTGGLGATGGPVGAPGGAEPKIGALPTDAGRQAAGGDEAAAGAAPPGRRRPSGVARLGGLSTVVTSDSELKDEVGDLPAAGGVYPMPQATNTLPMSVVADEAPAGRTAEPAVSPARALTSHREASASPSIGTPHSAKSGGAGSGGVAGGRFRAASGGASPVSPGGGAQVKGVGANAASAGVPAGSARSDGDGIDPDPGLPFETFGYRAQYAGRDGDKGGSSSSDGSAFATDIISRRGPGAFGMRPRCSAHRLCARCLRSTNDAMAMCCGCTLRYKDGRGEGGVGFCCSNTRCTRDRGATHRGSRRCWRRVGRYRLLYLFPLLIILAGAAVATWLYDAQQWDLESRIATNFVNLWTERADTLRVQFAAHARELEALTKSFAVVPEDDFVPDNVAPLLDAAFTTAKNDNPGVLALAYIPVVNHTQRAAFESQLGEALNGTGSTRPIWGLSQHWVAAVRPEHEVYLPVTTMRPALMGDFEGFDTISLADFVNPESDPAGTFASELDVYTNGDSLMSAPVNVAGVRFTFTFQPVFTIPAVNRSAAFAIGSFDASLYAVPDTVEERRARVRSFVVSFSDPRDLVSRAFMRTDAWRVRARDAETMASSGSAASGNGGGTIVSTFAVPSDAATAPSGSGGEGDGASAASPDEDSAGVSELGGVTIVVEDITNTRYSGAAPRSQPAYWDPTVTPDLWAQPDGGGACGRGMLHWEHFDALAPCAADAAMCDTDVLSADIVGKLFASCRLIETAHPRLRLHGVLRVGRRDIMFHIAANASYMEARMPEPLASASPMLYAVSVTAGSILVAALVAFGIRFGDTLASRNAERALRMAAEAAHDAHEATMNYACHELRNPLHAISLACEFLKDGIPAGSELRTDVDSIALASASMRTLVDDILDLNRLRAGHVAVNVSEVNVRQLMRSLASQHRGQADVPIRCCVADDVPEIVYQDELRMRQVLVNALTNACKATAEGEIVLYAWLQVAALDATAEQRLAGRTSSHGDDLQRQASSRRGLGINRGVSLSGGFKSSMFSRRSVRVHDSGAGNAAASGSGGGGGGGSAGASEAPGAFGESERDSWAPSSGSGLDGDGGDVAHLVFEVVDTGIGLRDSPETLFLPFRQTSVADPLTVNAAKHHLRTAQGAGLGLPIARLLAHALGGDVGLRDRSAQKSNDSDAVVLAIAESGTSGGGTVTIGGGGAAGLTVQQSSGDGGGLATGSDGALKTAPTRARKASTSSAGPPAGQAAPAPAPADAQQRQQHHHHHRGTVFWFLVPLFDGPCAPDPGQLRRGRLGKGGAGAGLLRGAHGRGQVPAAGASAAPVPLGSMGDSAVTDPAPGYARGHSRASHQSTRSWLASGHSGATRSTLAFGSSHTVTTARSGMSHGTRSGLSDAGGSAAHSGRTAPSGKADAYPQPHFLHPQRQRHGEAPRRASLIGGSGRLGAAAAAAAAAVASIAEPMSPAARAGAGPAHSHTIHFTEVPATPGPVATDSPLAQVPFGRQESHASSRAAATIASGRDGTQSPRSDIDAASTRDGLASPLPAATADSPRADVEGRGAAPSMHSPAAYGAARHGSLSPIAAHGGSQGSEHSSVASGGAPASAVLGRAPLLSPALAAASSDSQSPVAGAAGGTTPGGGVVMGVAARLGAAPSLVTAMDADTPGPVRRSASRSSGGPGTPSHGPRVLRALSSDAGDGTPTGMSLVGCHILIVDDDSLNRKLASRMFHTMGATCHMLTDGDEVLPYLRRYHPDVLGIMSPASQASAGRGGGDEGRAHAASEASDNAEQRREPGWAGAGDVGDGTRGGGGRIGLSLSPSRAARVPLALRSPAGATMTQLEDDGAFHGPGRRYGRLDAIMLDIVMARMQGTTCCEQLRREYGVTLPIFAATGNTNPADVASYEAAGFTALIAKPFGRTQIQRMMSKFVRPASAARSAPGAAGGAAAAVLAHSGTGGSTLSGDSSGAARARRRSSGLRHNTSNETDSGFSYQSGGAPAGGAGSGSSVGGSAEAKPVHTSQGIGILAAEAAAAAAMEAADEKLRRLGKLSSKHDIVGGQADAGVTAYGVGAGRRGTDGKPPVAASAASVGGASMLASTAAKAPLSNVSEGVESTGESPTHPKRHGASDGDDELDAAIAAEARQYGI